MSTRTSKSELAGLLAEHFAVLSYDRRGRGDKGRHPALPVRPCRARDRWRVTPDRTSSRRPPDRAWCPAQGPRGDSGARHRAAGRGPTSRAGRSLLTPSAAPAGTAVRPVRPGGSPSTSQCVKVPPGASGSSISMASSWVPGGGVLHSRRRSRLEPSRVNARGNVPPGRSGLEAVSGEESSWLGAFIVEPPHPISDSRNKPGG